VLDSVINYLDKFGPELLVIQFGFLVILSTLFLWLWFSNRRKYHNLKHAIPANVVKSYLDSIIQNSTSLKSQLFRGGGLDASGVPSVMPLQHLTGGEGLAVSGAPATALMEELNQKKALIAALESQLATAQSAQSELESKFNHSQSNLHTAENKIKELEALLGQSRKGAGDESLKAELNMVTKERDEIRDRLKEFEIIADDLANLKRLQQENDQLRRSLAAQGGSLPPANTQADDEISAPEEKNSSDNMNAMEDFLSAANEEDTELASPEGEAPAEEVQAAAEESVQEEQKPKSEKTPEDLLSEFEKMLG
jgi:predicted nuclease with TOPRIM domain